MNKRKIIGIVLVVIGIVSSSLGYHYKGKVAQAKEAIGKASRTFSETPFGKKASDILEERASAYDGLLAVMTYGGIVLIVAGGIVVFMPKKR